MMTPNPVRSAPPARLARHYPLTSWTPEYWHALGVFTWIFAGSIYLSLPPSPDQFNHAYMGWLTLSGGVPYVDFIDVNWPGVFGLHALATWVFGVHLWTWRALDFLLFACSALFLIDLVRRAGGSVAAQVCAVASPLLYVSAGFWVAGQHDMSAAQFLVVALWFHVRGYETEDWRWQLGMGLMLGIAMLNKPTVGAMLPLMSLQALLLGTPWRRFVEHSAAAMVALTATVVAGFAFVLLLGTTLDDLIEVPYLFSVSTQYIYNPNAASLSGVFLITMGRSWAYVFLASAPAVVWLFRPANRSIASTALPILWLTGLISYFVQSKAFVYHLTPSFLAMIGLLSVSAAVLLNGELFASKPKLNRIALAGLMLIVVAHGGVRLTLSYGTLPGAILARDASGLLARFVENDDISIDDAVKFARRVGQGTQSGCLLLVGESSSINYLSRLRQPTGFYYFPVIAKAVPTLPMADKWHARWAADLNAADCHFALVARRVRDNWLTKPSPMADTLREFLLRYKETGIVGKSGGLIVFERQ